MKFHSRNQWGARSPRGRSRIGSVYGVTIHWHGGGLGNYAHSRCDDLIQSMQRYHMDHNGWSDIGYNAVVCRHGHVYEGRGLKIRGAHAGASNIGGNSNWYGLQAMVGVGDVLTPELFDGLRDGVIWMRNKGRAGNRINGHRDHHATACPGDVLYRWAHGTPMEDEDMSITEQDEKRIAERTVRTLLHRFRLNPFGPDEGHPDDGKRTYHYIVNRTYGLVQRMWEEQGGDPTVDVNEEALADALLPGLRDVLSAYNPDEIASAVADALPGYHLIPKEEHS